MFSQYIWPFPFPGYCFCGWNFIVILQSDGRFQAGNIDCPGLFCLSWVLTGESHPAIILVHPALLPSCSNRTQCKSLKKQNQNIFSLSHNLTKTGMIRCIEFLPSPNLHFYLNCITKTAHSWYCSVKLTSPLLCSIGFIFFSMGECWYSTCCLALQITHRISAVLTPRRRPPRRKYIHLNPQPLRAGRSNRCGGSVHQFLCSSSSSEDKNYCCHANHRWVHL